MSIDYKELLKKYIYHVCEEEGACFIDDWRPSMRPRFNEQETEELFKIKKELFGEDE